MKFEMLLIVALTLLCTATISNAQNSRTKTYTNADFIKTACFKGCG